MPWNSQRKTYQPPGNEGTDPWNNQHPKIPKLALMAALMLVLLGVLRVTLMILDIWRKHLFIIFLI